MPLLHFGIDQSDWLHFELGIARNRARENKIVNDYRIRLAAKAEMEEAGLQDTEIPVGAKLYAVTWYASGFGGRKHIYLFSADRAGTILINLLKADELGGKIYKKCHDAQSPALIWRNPFDGSPDPLRPFVHCLTEQKTAI